MDQTILDNLYTIVVLPLLRHGLTTLGGSLSVHGYLNGSTTEQFVAAGMLIAGVLWSLGKNYGQTIIANERDRLATMKKPAAPSVTKS